MFERARRWVEPSAGYKTDLIVDDYVNARSIYACEAFTGLRIATVIARRARFSHVFGVRKDFWKTIKSGKAVLRDQLERT